MHAVLVKVVFFDRSSARKAPIDGRFAYPYAAWARQQETPRNLSEPEVLVVTPSVSDLGYGKKAIPPRNINMIQGENKRGDGFRFFMKIEMFFIVCYC